MSLVTLPHNDLTSQQNMKTCIFLTIRTKYTLELLNILLFLQNDSHLLVTCIWFFALLGLLLFGSCLLIFRKHLTLYFFFLPCSLHTMIFWEIQLFLLVSIICLLLSFHRYKYSASYQAEKCSYKNYLTHMIETIEFHSIIK